MKSYKNLLWWLYGPNDEREERLYYQAYKRSSQWFLIYISLVVVDILLHYFVPIEMGIVSLSSILVGGILIIIIGLVSGAWVFHNQDVSFTGQSSNNYWHILLEAGLVLSIFVFASLAMRNDLMATLEQYQSLAWILFISFLIALGILIVVYLLQKKR